MHSPTLPQLTVTDLGVCDYQQGWDLQRRLVAARARDECGDTLVLCEHPHVITVGRTAGAHAHVTAPGTVPVIEVFALTAAVPPS